MTLNYDRLSETASVDAKRPLRVLPFEALDRDKRWLLKMHGDVEHPESIVLTRGDYLDFRTQSRALASLAKALLMTKHLFFVGFGLSDDHFHEIVHDVRKGWPAKDAKKFIGTALVLGNPAIHRAIWGEDLEIVSFDAETIDGKSRKLEVFLDVLGAYSSSGEAFMMDPRYESELTEAECQINSSLRELAAMPTDKQWDTGQGRRLRATLADLG